jgi:hypothetical protein
VMVAGSYVESAADWLRTGLKGPAVAKVANRYRPSCLEGKVASLVWARRWSMTDRVEG